MRKMYECPDCGARSCEEVELNTYHCHLCDVDFDIEEMGFDEAAQPSRAADVATGHPIADAVQELIRYIESDEA